MPAGIFMSPGNFILPDKVRFTGIVKFAGRDTLAGRPPGKIEFTALPSETPVAKGDLY
jgi:hypothetical protein